MSVIHRWSTLNVCYIQMKNSQCLLYYRWSSLNVCYITDEVLSMSVIYRWKLVPGCLGLDRSIRLILLSIFNMIAPDFYTWPQAWTISNPILISFLPSPLVQFVVSHALDIGTYIRMLQRGTRDIGSRTINKFAPSNFQGDSELEKSWVER